jgi:DNA helicase HerA-like ATPase
MTDDILDRDPLADASTADQSPTNDEGPAEGTSAPAERSGTGGASSDGSEAATAQSTADGAGDAGTAEVTAEAVPSDVEPIADAEVGHLMASEGIQVGREAHDVTAFVATERRDTVRVGDYVEVPYPDVDERLFGVVDALGYEPYTDLDDRSDAHNRIAAAGGLDESEYVLRAKIDPIAIVAGSADPARRLVNRVPKPNAPVRLSRDEATLRTGLNVPDDGVFCGYLSVGGQPMTVDGDPFPYYLTNPGIGDDGSVESGEPAVFRHALVAGSTGKGKTHFTKNLLRQFVDGKQYPIEHHETGDTLRKELNVVVLDPENEYWQLRDDNPELPPDRERELREQDVAVGGVDDCGVFVPAAAGTDPPSTGQSRRFGIPFDLVRGKPQLLMPYDLSDLTAGAIRNVVRAYFARDDRPSTYEDFLAFLDANEDALVDRFDLAEGTWGAVMRRVQDPAYGAVFDRGDTPVTELTGELFRPGRVTVIPTSHLRGGKEELVVLSLLSLIIDNKVSDYRVDPHIKDTPMLVAVDEAHSYVGEPDSTRSGYIVGRAREAAKRGRKDKLGLFLITQNPEDVDDEVLKQCNTNVFFGLRDEVVRSVPSVPTAFARDIPAFGKGQAVVKAPDVEAVEVVGLRHTVTRHDS